jgi:ankyrin repeat protein
MKKRHLSIFGWNKKRLSEKKSKRSSREIKPTLKQLHDAIYEEKIAQVKQIIETDNELINQKKNARTALHVAARSGNSELVELLLANGANPNIGDDAGWTGIHCAAFSGNFKTLEALIKVKTVNLAVKNADENTALHYIARHCTDVPDSILNDLVKVSCIF